MRAELITKSSAVVITRHLLRRVLPDAKFFMWTINPYGCERTTIMNVIWYDAPSEETVREELSFLTDDNFYWLTPRGKIIPTGIKFDGKNLDVKEINKSDEPMLNSSLILFPFGTLNLIRMVSLERANYVKETLIKKYRMPENKLTVVCKVKQHGKHPDYRLSDSHIVGLPDNSKGIDWVERANLLFEKE